MGLSVLLGFRVISAVFDRLLDAGDFEGKEKRFIVSPPSMWEKIRDKCWRETKKIVIFAIFYIGALGLITYFFWETSPFLQYFRHNAPLDYYYYQLKWLGHGMIFSVAVAVSFLGFQAAEDWKLADKITTRF